MNSSFAEPGLVLQPEQPVEGQERGVGNHGSAGLLASSAGRGWSGLAAELRSHSGVIAWQNPRPDTEICVDVHGGASVVTRQRDGVTDRTVSERGTIWLSPARGPDGGIEMSDPLPAILHIYLPPSQFSPKSLGEGSDPSAVASLRFESSFQDPLVAEMAYAITSELQRETSVGSMLIETLASSLAARLVQNHVGTLARDVSARATQAGLDRRRLTRVNGVLHRRCFGHERRHGRIHGYAVRQLSEARDIARPSQQVTLGLVAKLVLEKFQLGGRLYTLR